MPTTLIGRARIKVDARESGRDQGDDRGPDALLPKCSERAEGGGWQTRRGDGRRPEVASRKTTLETPGHDQETNVFNHADPDIVVHLGKPQALEMHLVEQLSLVLQNQWYRGYQSFGCCGGNLFGRDIEHELCCIEELCLDSPDVTEMHMTRVQNRQRKQPGLKCCSTLCALLSATPLLH